jgi:ADP-dependent phosphofructokinase/glucokinase
MKYNQLIHKQNLESKLLSLFYSLGIEEDRLSTITVQELRDEVDAAYPILQNESDENKQIVSARDKVMNLALDTMYYYNLIKKREQQ